MAKEIFYFIDSVLLWDEFKDIRRRILVTFIIALILWFIISFIIITTELPPKDRFEDSEMEERIAEFILEKKEIPPEPEPEIPPEEEPEPEEEEPEPEPEPEPEKPEEDKAKEKAEKLLEDVAMFDDLRAMENLVDPAQLNMAGADMTEIKRDAITGRAMQGSGGIRVANVSSGGGGGGTLGGANMAAVESDIADRAQRREVGRDGKVRRTTQQIRLTVDQHAGAINAIYQRALRKNPSLEGTIVFRMVIAPSGEITKLEIISSDLKDPDLERKILARMKLITFPQAEVEVWDGEYPLTFFPA